MQDSDKLIRELHAAQKTVAVLKERVRALYNEGAQTAIHQQLALAQKRQEENRRKRAVMQAKNEALERHSTVLETQVRQRTRQIRSILDNVVFGFVIVDAQGMVQPGFTASCAELLGAPVREGQAITELLQITDSDTQAAVEIGLEQVFDDFMPEQVSLDQIPSRFPIGARVLRCQGRAIRDEAGAISGILFTLSDVTDLEAARKQAHDNAVLVGILQQKPAFAAFVDDAFGRLDAAQESVSDQDFVRRAVHTVKGNAASYGLNEVAAAAHWVESGPAISEQGIDTVRRSLEDFLEQKGAMLGLGLGAESVEIPLSELRSMRGMLNPVNLKGLERWSAEVCQRPARDLLGPLEVFVGRLAERLDRSVVFTLDGADTLVDPQAIGEVLSTLTHLLRNAVDHGLEPEFERGDKPPAGRLGVSISRKVQSWCIVVEDDGRGVQVDAVARRALEVGKLDARSVDGLSREEKLDLIFLDGLSSKYEASEISGRGVGMSAVREAVLSAGGEMQVLSRCGKGTRVEIEIPLPEVMRQAA